MRIALKEAELAYEKGEIPVGAVIVSQNQILAKTHNLTEQLKDVSAHAELLAITAASSQGEASTLFITRRNMPLL